MKDRIKKLRKALGLTQQEFSERIGIKRNTVAQYEMGRNPPTATVIELICREFRVNETWLRTGEGEMFASMSREQEIAEFFADLFSDNDSAKIAIVRALARIPESGWDMIKDFALDVAAAVKRKEEKLDD